MEIRRDTTLQHLTEFDTGWSYESQRWQGTQQDARTDVDIYGKSSCLEKVNTLTLSAQGLPAVKEEVSGGKMQGWLLANRPMNLDAIVAPSSDHSGSHHATWRPVMGASENCEESSRQLRVNSLCHFSEN